MTHTGPRAPRFKIKGLTVVYDAGDSFWSGPVTDMSESGIFVETTHSLPVGTRVTLMPEVSEDEQLPFEIQAEVVRVNEYDLDEHFDRTPGIAFRLVGLSLENFAQVRQFLLAHGVPARGAKPSG
jgi:hypothetical protein